MLISKLYRKGPILALFISFFGWFIFLSIVASLKAFGETMILSLPSDEKIVEIFWLSFIFLTFLILTMIFSSCSVWFQKFELRNGKIIDYFPGKRVYNVKDIQQIVIETPKSAYILIKSPEASILRCVFWFGNSEADWLEFILELKNIDKEIVNKCHYILKRKPGSPYQQACPKECYDRILKRFNGIKRY